MSKRRLCDIGDLIAGEVALRRSIAGCFVPATRRQLRDNILDVKEYTKVCTSSIDVSTNKKEQVKRRWAAFESMKFSFAVLSFKAYATKLS